MLRRKCTLFWISRRADTTQTPDAGRRHGMGPLAEIRLFNGYGLTLAAI